MNKSIDLINMLVENPFLDKEDVKCILTKVSLFSIDSPSSSLTRENFSQKIFFPDVQSEGVI